MHTTTKFISPLSVAIDRSIIGAEIIAHTYQGSVAEMIAEVKMIAESWDCGEIRGDDDTIYDIYGTMEGGHDFRLSVSCLLHN